ncbi:MAG: glycosyltransferase [Campylobacteraceae bacterium]|nr:glycosyltransferase [Campylobacteraceae bacterium]
MAIESILQQSYKIDEIIIIDDGSTDNTQEILRNFDMIKIIKTRNFGVSHARNIGIKNAKNSWITFLDSDDTWMKDKIKQQINFHKNNSDILVSHTHEKWIRNNKRIKYPKSLKKPSKECFLDNLSKCKIATSSIMIHKNVFDDIGYFDESMRVCEDYDMFLKITFKYKIGLLKDELITKYAGHDQLSAHIFAIDRFHLHSLLKFLNTRFHDGVVKEIKRKCDILAKGARKHKNQEILKMVGDIQSQILPKP